jgi:manganese/zinc/iron transport system permease protein
LGDALAHAALPGVALAFLLTGEKQMIVLLAGGGLSSWLGALSVQTITAHSRIKEDTALGIVLSALFGLGILLLSVMQNSPTGNQAGLASFIFGKAAALTTQDVIAIGSIFGLLVLILAFAFKRLGAVVFDHGFARSIGLPVRFLQIAITSLIVAAVVVGLQAVGVVLISALLIAPAASARQWTNTFGTMILLAAMFGMIAGIGGALVSFLAPAMPTGPWVVVVISLIFLISVLISPRRGIVTSLVRSIRLRLQMNQDHLLKESYRLAEKSGRLDTYIHLNELRQQRSFTTGSVWFGLLILEFRQLIRQSAGMAQLTPTGIAEAARVIRRHRLWEVYLSRHFELPADHLHRDAEKMEHLITPQMEEALSKFLDNPQTDPHDRPIPYASDGRTTPVNMTERKR